MRPRSSPRASTRLLEGDDDGAGLVRLPADEFGELVGIDMIIAIRLYFSVIAALRASYSDPLTYLAVAVTSTAPSATLPRALHGRSVTCGLLRMRLTLPESRSVTKPSVPSASGVIHTGDDTRSPLLRNVVIDTYSSSLIAIDSG